MNRRDLLKLLTLTPLACLGLAAPTSPTYVVSTIDWRGGVNSAEAEQRLLELLAQCARDPYAWIVFPSG